MLPARGQLQSDKGQQEGLPAEPSGSTGIKAAACSLQEYGMPPAELSVPGGPEHTHGAPLTSRMKRLGRGSREPPRHLRSGSDPDTLPSLAWTHYAVIPLTVSHTRTPRTSSPV